MVWLYHHLHTFHTSTSFSDRKEIVTATFFFACADNIAYTLCCRTQRSNNHRYEGTLHLLYSNKWKKQYTWFLFFHIIVIARALHNSMYYYSLSEVEFVISRCIRSSPFLFELPTCSFLRALLLGYKYFSIRSLLVSLHCTRNWRSSIFL